MTIFNSYGVGKDGRYYSKVPSVYKPKSDIVTRFAPSPTGNLHIGGARTAIFNWLYAKSVNGKFLLRIEDTDKERSKQEYTDSILEAMNWLGIDYERPIIYQSHRRKIYQKYIDKLLESGHAYYCHCTKEETKKIKECAKETHGQPIYTGNCRDKNLNYKEGCVIRLKTPDDGKTEWVDKVKNKMSFNNRTLEDQIIVRSDGSVMYNFACVIDDIEQGVNTIIRGDDHIVNTPFQICIYNALNIKHPTYAHVSMVLGSGKKKLSKRDGAKSILEYKDEGYLPDAIINYLVRLGWSSGNKEYFQISELKNEFNMDKLSKSAASFDNNKLKAVNAWHINKAYNFNISRALAPIMSDLEIDISKDTNINDKIDAVKTKCKTLKEIADKILVFYNDKIEYDDDKIKKHLNKSMIPLLKAVQHRLNSTVSFTKYSVVTVFEEIEKMFDIKLAKYAQGIRIAITGETESPGIYETIVGLGKTKVVNRIQKVIDKLAEV